MVASFRAFSSDIINRTYTHMSDRHASFFTYFVRELSRYTVTQRESEEMDAMWDKYDLSGTGLFYDE